MLLKDFIPAPDVQEFVQLYRIVHLRFEKGQPIPVKAYPPRPEHCLAFYPYDTETVEYLSSGKEVKHVPIVLYGQFTEVTNRIIGNNFLVFQVIFIPVLYTDSLEFQLQRLLTSTWMQQQFLMYRCRK